MEALPILLIVIAATTLYFLIKKYSSRSDSKHHKKDSVSTKVNIVVGGTPPPGGITFKPDGTIERVPDSLATRHKWTVQKMTRKIEQEPDDEWYFERGKALMELRQYQEAIPDFSKIIEKYPTFGGYYEFRGLCYLHAGEKANALADFQRYNELTNKEHLHESTIKILDKLEKELLRKNI